MDYEIVYVVMGLLGLYIFFGRSKKLGRIIDGPKGLPVLGSVLEINDENIHFKFNEYAQQYGEIFQVKMLFDNVVVLNSEEIIRKAFGDEKYKILFSDRLEMFYGEHFTCKSQALAFIVDGPSHLHRTVKKFVLQALHAYGSGLQELETNVMVEIADLIQRIETLQGEEFECVAMFQRSISNVMSLALSGETISDGDDDVNIFQEQMHVEDFFLNSYVNFMMSAFPFLRYLPGKYEYEYRRAKQINAKIVRRYFHAIKKTHVPGKVRGIVDLLVEEQRKQMESGTEIFFTDQRIIAQVVDLIGAGVLTTWSTLSNTMLILLNFPQYQTKIQEEVDREIGQRQPSYSDRNKCTFFKAFEMEVHRYLPVVPLLLPHVCRQHVHFEGYDIPQNSTVFANAWFVHHNEDIWGDPWTFRPERFLDEHGQLLPSEHKLRKNLMPFGHGLRQCPGEMFAKTRYFLFISSLLQRWRFEFPEEKHRSCDPRVSENFETSVVVRPKPFFCCALKRT